MPEITALFNSFGEKSGLAAWSGPGAEFDAAALVAYLRCFRDAKIVLVSCEDYRAAASIELRHDEADMDVRVACSLLVL